MRLNREREDWPKQNSKVQISKFPWEASSLVNRTVPFIPAFDPRRRGRNTTTSMRLISLSEEAGCWSPCKGFGELRQCSNVRNSERPLTTCHQYCAGCPGGNIDPIEMADTIGQPRAHPTHQLLGICQRTGGEEPLQSGDYDGSCVEGRKGDQWEGAEEMRKGSEGRVAGNQGPSRRVSECPRSQ